MTDPSTLLLPRIEHQILVIRGQKVMIDADLAALYGVPTKALNQAVKRNAARFPADFMFQLTDIEKSEVVTNCDHLVKFKFSKSLPFAFTEYGAGITTGTRQQFWGQTILRSSLAKSHQYPILEVKIDIAVVFIAYSAI